MATLPPTIADLAPVPNVPLTDPGDQVVQYRQAGFAFWTFAQLLGTVELSCNGLVAGAGNNILSEADIRFGNGGAVRAWGVIRLGGTGTTRLVVHFLENAASTTPRAWEQYLCQAAMTGGTTTALPTSTVADRLSTAVGTNLIPWSTPVAGAITYQTSATARVGLFMIKRLATNDASIWIVDRGYAGDTLSDGLYDWGLLHYANVAASLAGVGRVGGYDGTAGTFLGTYWDGSTLSGWTGGTPSDSRPRFFPLQTGAATSVSEDCRCLGTTRLLRAVPTGTPYNYGDPTDPPADLWERRVVGLSALWWRKADGLIA